VVDLDNKTVTYTLTSIQEKSTATGSGTYNEDYAPSRLAFYISAMGANRDNGYDNLVIRIIPEPTSLFLLCIAGVCYGASYRPRKRCGPPVAKVCE